MPSSPKKERPLTAAAEGATIESPKQHSPRRGVRRPITDASELVLDEKELAEQLEQLEVFRDGGGENGGGGGMHVTDDRQFAILAHHMELRSFPAGEYFLVENEATPPALYVLLSGTCKKESSVPGSSFKKKVEKVQVFGQELLAHAEFRKTKGGKLLQGLVTAPYSVWADSDCRCAVLTAVACREALREAVPDEEEEDEPLDESSAKEEDEEDSEDEEGEEVTGAGEEDEELLIFEDDEEKEEEEEAKHRMIFGGEQGKSKIGRPRPPPLNICHDRIDDEELDAFTAPVYPKTEKEKHLIEEAMKDRPMMKHLPEKTRDKLTYAFKNSKVKEGKEIAKQGANDDCYYIVKKGEVEVVVDGETATDEPVTLKAGESFGDQALTTQAPRNASIRAKTDAKLFRLDQETYRKLVAKDARDERQRKLELLREVELLRHISFFNREKLVSIMEPHKIRKGEILCHKEKSGKNFFIVDEGEIVCQNAASKLMGAKEDFKLGPEGYCGHQLLGPVRNPVKADVVGSKPGKVYRISHEQFREVIGTPHDLIPVEDRTLGGIIALQRRVGQYLEDEEILRLSHCIHNVKYKEGDEIVELGVEMEPAIYIVREGEALATEGRMLTTVPQGCHFGEKLFIEAREKEDVTGVSKATLVAQTRCVVGILTISDYYDAMSDVEGLKDAKAAQEAKGKKKKKGGKAQPVRHQRWPRIDIELSALERLVCLGQGNFGQVWLVTERNEENKVLKKPCVLKIQSKHYLVERNKVKICIEEKHLLQRLRHPFVVELVNAYQDPRSVHMLLEYLPGGELYTVLNPWEGQIVLGEDQAKFYALAIADALAYMHYKDIIFRDLKPENVMIDRRGYPKIIDFGFAKCIQGETFTLCGTPGYLAPEVVLNIGHGKPADHWQLGVLIYDMLSFESPYFDDDADQEELVRCVIEDPIPPMVRDDPISEEVWDLISRLLVKDPKHRLGSLQRGERDILHHKWFKDLSLTKLRKKTMTAPWVPEMEDPYDTSNFDDWDDLEDITTRESPELTEAQAKLFENF